MAMFVAVAHTQPWETLKYCETVMYHLNKQSVYAYVENFNMEKANSPGNIGQIHPKLINLRALKVALEVGMRSAKCDEERTVSEWKKKYQNEQDLYNTIPYFKVFIKNKRWGPYHNRIEVTLLVIDYAAKDGAYIKTVLSKAYKKVLIEVGKFIPQEYHHMEGEEAYWTQLRLHNEYIQSITAVITVGMHPDTLWMEIRLNREEMYLEHYLNHVHPSIESVQETNNSEERAMYLLICTKKNTPDVIRFVDNMLPEIFKTNVSAEDKLEGLEFPIWLTNSGNKTIGSYAVALTKSVTPNHSHHRSTINNQLDQTPI
eukprot:11465767-Ditylum_brightwellii.AAC.1